MAVCVYGDMGMCVRGYGNVIIEPRHVQCIQMHVYVEWNG